VNYQEKERLILSVVIALIAHLIFAFLFTLFGWNFTPKKEVLGPMYVEISPLPGSAIKSPDVEDREAPREAPDNPPSPEVTTQEDSAPLQENPVIPQNPPAEAVQEEQGLSTPEPVVEEQITQGEVLPETSDPVEVVQGEDKPSPVEETVQQDRVETPDPVQEEEDPSPWFDQSLLEESLAASQEQSPVGTADSEQEDPVVQDIAGIEWDDPTKGRELLYGPPIILPEGFSEQLSFEIEFEITEAGNLVPLKVIPEIVYLEVRNQIFEQLRQWRFKPAPSASGEDNVVRGRIPIDTVIKR